MSEQSILTPTDATLTQKDAPADAKATGDAIRDLQSLIGDTPASEQISAAITYHEHKNYASKEEFETLKNMVMQLVNLIGDTPVSEQISAAYSSINEILLTKINL